MKSLPRCILLVLTLGSQFCFAGLKQLVEEAVKNNQIIKVNQLEVQASQLEMLKLSSANSWSLIGDLSHKDSFRDAILSFQSLRTINQSLSLALQKKFSWGGDLKLEQGFVSYNLTKWGNAGAAFTAPGSRFETRPYEYISRVTFSQDLTKDFMGRGQKLDYRAIEADVKLKQKEVMAQEEELLGQLVNLYIQAGYYKSLIKVTKGNIKRYSKRKKIVSKRVKEGLRLEVDSLQVESAYIAQKNQLFSLEDQLSQAIEKIGIILERDCDSKEVVSMSRSPRGGHANWLNWEFKNNLELEKAQAQLIQIDTILEKAKRDLLPQVKFVASLGTNAIEPTLGNALSQGNIDSRFQDKSVGVNVVIPLGRKMAKANLEQNHVRKLQQETRIDMMKKGMQIQFNSLKKRINLLKKQVRSQKQQLSVLKKVQSSYDKLYNQGRVEIDTVLNAEDSYSQAQTSFYQTLLSYELLFWEFSVLTDHIKDYFENYKESL